MTNRAISDFRVCQRKAQAEFVEFYEFPARETEQANKLTWSQDEFLKWEKEPKTLKKLEYVDILTAKDSVLEHAQEELFVEYKHAIVFFCDQKL